MEVFILFELFPHLVGRQAAVPAKPIATMRPGAAQLVSLLSVGTGRRALRPGTSAHRLRNLLSPALCRARHHRRPGLRPDRYIRSCITRGYRRPVGRRRRWQRDGKGARQHQQHDGVRRDHFLGSFSFNRLCRLLRGVHLSRIRSSSQRLRCRCCPKRQAPRTLVIGQSAFPGTANRLQQYP